MHARTHLVARHVVVGVRAARGGGGMEDVGRGVDGGAADDGAARANETDDAGADEVGDGGGREGGVADVDDEASGLREDAAEAEEGEGGGSRATWRGRRPCRRSRPGR